MKAESYKAFIYGAVILMIGTNIIWKDIWKENYDIDKQLVQYIQERIEENYFPQVSYKESESKELPVYIWERALDILPVAQFDFDADGHNIEDEETYQLLLKLQEINEKNDKSQQKRKQEVGKKIDLSLDKLKDFEYLISKFYTVDSVTYVKPSDFDASEMLKKDLKISKGKGPKILVFHTHSQESFSDSKQNDGYSIVNAGDTLCDILEDKYGIQTLHHKGVYDKVNGSLDRSQAYERARPEIAKILEKYPSIEIVIDLHRDGVGKNTRLVTEIDKKPTAQIMFFNGMCRTRTNGELTGMGNPYLSTNLALSLQMKVAAETYYPGFTRRNYLKGYKYNMDLAPRMLLIEAGAQTNTVEEIDNAMEPLAEILHLVVGY